MPGRLHPEDVAAIARAVVEQLEERDARSNQLVDASSLAAELGVSRAYVYEHADALGAQPLGDGPKPRLRFDLEQARERLTACSVSKRSQATPGHAQSGDGVGAGRGKRPPLPARLPETGSVLRSRPREGTA